MSDASPSEQVTDAGYETLARESREARHLDVDLARSLHQMGPSGATGSASYLRELDRRPRESPDAERQLVMAARSGDRHARDKLVEAYLPFVASVASMYRGSPGISRLELMQEGVVGLLRALERYDAELEVPFGGYASWWVRQAMQRLVAELTRPLVLSDRTLRQLAQVRRARDGYVSRHGREPSGDQLASDAGVSHAHLRDLLVADGVPRSLDEPVSGPEGDIGSLGESVTDPTAEDAYQQLLDTSEIQQVQALLGSLSDRERLIIRSHYGLDGPERSLRVIGEDLGLSPERVRQIETRALGKLRSSAS